MWRCHQLLSKLLANGHLPRALCQPPLLVNDKGNRFLRSLSGIKLRDRIISEKIRTQWKVEEIIDEIQNYQQKWNQQVLRMPENRLLRKSLEYQPQDKRDLGRPYRSVVGKTSSCSCRTGIDYPKLRMENEEEEEKRSDSKV